MLSQIWGWVLIFYFNLIFRFLYKITFFKDEIKRKIPVI